jgi:hypothetical protein
VNDRLTSAVVLIGFACGAAIVSIGVLGLDVVLINVFLGLD